MVAYASGGRDDAERHLKPRSRNYALLNGLPETRVKSRRVSHRSVAGFQSLLENGSNTHVSEASRFCKAPPACQFVVKVRQVVMTVYEARKQGHTRSVYFLGIWGNFNAIRGADGFDTLVVEYYRRVFDGRVSRAVNQPCVRNRFHSLLPVVLIIDRLSRPALHQKSI